jgi:hypothetical protein
VSLKIDGFGWAAVVIFSASVENQIEREENAETLTAEWRYISRRTLASIEKIEKKEQTISRRAGDSLILTFWCWV